MENMIDEEAAKAKVDELARKCGYLYAEIAIYTPIADGYDAIYRLAFKSEFDNYKLSQNIYYGESGYVMIDMNVLMLKDKSWVSAINEIESKTKTGFNIMTITKYIMNAYETIDEALIRLDLESNE